MSTTMHKLLVIGFILLVSNLAAQDINPQMVKKINKNCKIDSKSIKLDTIRNEIQIKLDHYGCITIIQLPDTLISNYSNLGAIIESGLDKYTILSSSKALEAEDGPIIWTYVIRDNLKKMYYDRYKVINLNNKNLLIQLHYQSGYKKNKIEKFNCVYNFLIK